MNHVLIVRKPIQERINNLSFLGENGCRIWKGAQTTGGYGIINVDGAIRRVHRVAYALANGGIDPKAEIHHLCGARLCVNPLHMSLTTRLEHPGHLAAINAAKTHCINGHEFTPENTILRKSNGHRQCRICHLMRMKKQNDKRKKPDHPRQSMRKKYHTLVEVRAAYAQRQREYMARKKEREALKRKEKAALPKEELSIEID